MHPSAPFASVPAWFAFTGNAAGVPRDAAVLLPLEEWRNFRPLWAAHAGRIGVLVGPTDAVDVLLAELDGVDAVGAPALTTAARGVLRDTLRARGWRGEWLDDRAPAQRPHAIAEAIAA